MNAAQPVERVSLLEIHGSVLRADDPGIGVLRARAHAAGVRPHCLCRTPGVEMYIAPFGAGYHAAG